MIFLKQKNCRYCNKTSQDFADFWDSVRILRLEQKWKIKEFEERKIVFFIIFAPLYYLSTVKVYSKLLLCEASNCDTHNISCHFGRYFTVLFWESICMPDITFRITYEEWWKKLILRRIAKTLSRRQHFRYMKVQQGYSVNHLWFTIFVLFHISILAHN